jgi:hypothetical protein
MRIQPTEGFLMRWAGGASSRPACSAVMRSSVPPRSAAAARHEPYPQPYSHHMRRQLLTAGRGKPALLRMRGAAAACSLRCGGAANICHVTGQRPPVAPLLVQKRPRMLTTDTVGQRCGQPTGAAAEWLAINERPPATTPHPPRSQPNQIGAPPPPNVQPLQHNRLGSIKQQHAYEIAARLQQRAHQLGNMSCSREAGPPSA